MIAITLQLIEEKDYRDHRIRSGPGEAHDERDHQTLVNVHGDTSLRIDYGHLCGHSSIIAGEDGVPE
jgi:hypothetical protein